MTSAREVNLGLCPEPEIAFPDTEFRTRHQQIRERMSGNLCRCGAYANIVTAIREVAQGDA